MLYKTLREEEANPELYNFMEESLLFYDGRKENYMNFHLQFLFKYARYQGIEPLKISDLIHEIESNNFLDLRSFSVVAVTPAEAGVHTTGAIDPRLRGDDVLLSLG